MRPDHPDYTLTPARYAKGMIAVRPKPDGSGYKTRAGYLAARMANGRHSGREGAYILTPTASERFVRLYAEGWDANAISGELIEPRAAA